MSGAICPAHFVKTTTNMTQISINGKEYKLSFNMFSAITFERLTGHNAFDMEYINGNQLQYSIYAAYAMLLANNDTSDMPDFDEWARSITSVDEMNQLLAKSAEEISAFYKPLPGDKKKSDKSGEQSKNV